MRNLWAKFRDLIPKQPLLVAEIVSGTAPYYSVTFADGGVQRVFAGADTYSAGAFVYVQDSKIVGPAPTLTDYTIDL